MPSLGLLALTGWMIVERPKAFIPTEDQGYLIVVVQTPDGTSRGSRPAGSSSGSSQIAGELARRPRRADRSTASTPSTRSTRPTPAPSFVILEEWHAPDRAGAAGRRPGGGAPGAGSPSRSARRGWRSSSRRRSSGLSPTGGFELHDRGPRGQGGRGDWPPVADQFLDAARKRPELAGVFTTFSARVPQLRFDIDRTKARRLDVPVSDVFSVLQTNLGGYYVNDFNLYGKIWKVMVQAEGRDRAPARGHRPTCTS